MFNFTSYKLINEDKYLVSYITKLDSDILYSHGLDFIKV